MEHAEPTDLSAAKLAELDAFLLELNRAAADVIAPLFRSAHAQSLAMEDKGKGVAGAFDPVTAADRGAEAAIRKLVGERYPAHGVIGEEFGSDRADADFVWVIDPVDGTRAFVAGLPVWTTLIALRHEGRPVLGSIAQPFIGEVFIGSQQNGSRLIARGEERVLRVRPCARVSEAVIATTEPFKLFKGKELDGWVSLQQQARIARYGCDAYAYAMVALGLIDLVVESGLKSWDIDAAVPVVEGAGGHVTDWRGDRVGRNGGQMIIAGDRRCLDDALATLTPAFVAT